MHNSSHSNSPKKVSKKRMQALASSSSTPASKSWRSPGFFGGVSGCKMQAGFRAWSFMLEGVFEVKGFRVWGFGPGCFNSLKF